MSNFSPKTYQIRQYEDTDLSQLSYYYRCFTILEKPNYDTNTSASTKGRNAYKISLAQMLHYMFDFGIGYNSKCSTTLTTQQQFNLCRYVNRHNVSGTEGLKRPATVADLKIKIRGVVEEMVRRAVKYNGNLIAKTNTIFPRYLFTLDKNLTTEKLKYMTGRDYVEVTDFENFAYTSDTGHDMPKYQNGYVPISAVRCVPNHDHVPHSGIKDTISFKWDLDVYQEGNGTSSICWGNRHADNIALCHHDGCHKDETVGKVSGFGDQSGYGQDEEAVASMTPSWDKPSGVTCHENSQKDPENTVPTSSGKMLSIRYHGRRYRLFKRID